jgi:3',5'-cyclic AMP phosphodiesterase CpdA
MGHHARKLRAVLTVLSWFAAIAGCGGLEGKPGDAARTEGNAADLAPIRRDAIPVLPDAGGDTEIGLLDADGVEASASADAIPPTTDGGVTPETPAPPATIVVLPDTQYYAFAPYTEVFAMQTQWILDQKAALNIQAVLHVGDIVDGGTPEQWTVANSAMRLLDGHVPYFLVPGNHDVDVNRKTLINDYFGPASMPWVTSTMTSGQIENNYAFVDIGPQKWLVLGLEFGPRDSVMTWADAVLKAYPNTPAIIVTHAYLYGDGHRYDINVSGLDKSGLNYQWYIPQAYGYTSSQGINDGEMIWQKLILPNPNVRLVFSGHVMSAARLTSTRPDGSRVHQMLSDYQWLNNEDFGYGYLRVLQFNFAKKTIQVQTYSPYVGDYLTDDANQFTLDLNL